MKMIITEDRLHRLVLKWLTDKFGGLPSVTSESNPTRVFYVKDGKVMIDYHITNTNVYVDVFNIWNGLTKIFGLDFSDVQTILKKWLMEEYGLRSNNVSARDDNPWWWKKVEEEL